MLAGLRVGFGSASDRVRRAVIVVACVLAFGFQGFIAQIHIHSAAPETVSAIAKVFATQAIGKHGPARLPDPENPAKCPLCQVAASLGSALGVSSLLIVMSAVPLLVEPILRHDRIRKPLPSYVWQSRGPPRL